MTEMTFQELIRRVRAGDAQASANLLRQYEQPLRLAVRLRLTNPRLRRALDSIDICQDILASFFVRAASGQYQLDTPQQLLKLLATMARNKVVKQAEKHKAARRDQRRECYGLVQQGEIADPRASPSSVVAQEEILRELRRRLTTEERYLAEQRAAGRSWNDLATELGADANALRMRLQRALDRAVNELGLDTE
jgi:RNA polymerase sigma-70 factor (ECF subfamily)